MTEMKKWTQKNRAHLSQAFCAAVAGKTRQYCDAVGLRYGTFEQWKEGYNRPSMDDERIHRLAEMIGFPKEKIFVQC